MLIKNKAILKVAFIPFNTIDFWLLSDEGSFVLERAEQSLREEWARAQKLILDLSLSWILSRLMVESVHHVNITQPCEGILVIPDEAEL